jgi:uncharacterized membrane protein YkvA (DUF1232 family)
MATKFMDFKESMTTELTDFIRSQAYGLSLTDFDRLVSDLPALRERFAKIPLQTYPYLCDQLEFLGLFVEEQVIGRNRDLAEEPVAEAAFALLYFQSTTDLIPDPIPNMGLLDDAMIVSMVLRRQERAFSRSSHSYMLGWPEPKFDVDQLLSVISPLRVTSFCSLSARQPPVANPRQSHWR